LLDAFTISVSIADIVTDVLVLLEFREMGYDVFFRASLAIFALAQVSYAFLFVATFASGRFIRFRVTVFLVVLPLGQLVPLFTWLEALHLPAVDRALAYCGLSPTSKAQSLAQADSGDSLWSFLQSKYQSHAGFLVEAFVEAVPQSVLQTVFVVLARRVTPLNTASVAISVFTIASKGYLISYALDLVTFLFNFLCIVADCLGLFGSATVLTLLGPEAPLPSLLLSLTAAGLVLSLVAGQGLLWFTIVDDHLKLRDKRRWPHGVRAVSHVAFDLYFVRVMAWLLAIIPCMVLFLGAKLALVPVLVLKSIDPDLVRHARFFRGLARFLGGRGGGSPEVEARLWTVNAYIARVRCSDVNIERSLLTTPAKDKAQVLWRWAADIGTRRPFVNESRGTSVSAGMGSALARSKAEEEDALVRAIMESLDSAQQEGSGMAAKLRSHLRHLRAVAWCERMSRTLWQRLQERSEVFRAGFGTAKLQAESRPLSAVLRVVALLALATIAICALPLGIVYMALLVLGVVFPVLHIPAVCSSGGVDGDVTMLPCTLTVAYGIALLCLMALAPLVARRQMLWYDVVDLHDLPEPFYSGAVLAEIRKRHLRDSMLRKRLGHYLAHHTLSFLEVNQTRTH